MDLSLLSVVLVIVAVVFVGQSVRVVPQQHAFVVERLGRYFATLGPGLNFTVPFIDRVAYRHELKEVPMDVAPQVCITKDNTQVQIDGILYYQVTDPVKASYGTSNYVMAIEQLAKTALRSEVGKRELDKLLQERTDINGYVIAALDEASPGWGVKVLRYEVKDITPPDAVLRAMQMQITAEREKRARIAQSEGERQQAINLADGEKAAAIARSEGDRAAAINQAQGEAAAILAVAEATAQAIERVGAAIAHEGGDKAVQLRVAEQYMAAFANIAKTGNTIVVPADLSDAGGLVATAMAVMRGMPGQAPRT